MGRICAFSGITDKSLLKKCVILCLDKLMRSKL